MAPHADTPLDDNVDRLPAPVRPAMSASPPRLLIVGAGSRGNGYARATGTSTNGIIVAVAEPIAYKRERLGEKYIWGKEGPSEGQAFTGWRDYLQWELERREREKRGETVPEAVDGVFICVLDEMHREAIVGLAPLGIHIMCEKPLATSLADCVSIYKALLPGLPNNKTPSKVFSIGHVLRYSPHNMLLRKLLLEDKVIGDIMSVNHTEPVGWWHFTHSYVRGNWRKESTTAPSLLTKSCHDIDLIMWLLCSPPPNAKSQKPHIPSTVSSSGSLQYFNKTRKPKAAGSATNCLTCPVEESCKYSAKSVYIGPKYYGLGAGNTNWPVDIVLPEIEECVASGTGEQSLLAKLADDYTSSTPQSEIDARNWFGRCVYEADNDVCDEQVVTMTWDSDPLPENDTAPDSMADPMQGRGAKTALFHMVAQTVKQCDRYTHIYGTEGEIYADSSTITVQDFNDMQAKPKVYKPYLAGGGHGGGDAGLARQFILAVDQVKNAGMQVEDAQREFVGCSLEECIRSHAMVFAAEEARTAKKVVDFPSWWSKEVEGTLLS
ncbi:hypothetical protein BP5796_00119 [Coleophoma crateriformis]|uniref:Gfo/Idh/MocA-like oxidoreductase N-terminal domain-containing protein n=1 Tax=Coleophoma crateriformis TaxID=565419 RepID=A0A3D8T731_9HELO|nr:hypothetical protein BP5796_00119 [Coleophoma crateriformis]